jgi:enoyl-CoA hydratase/carnithine racemase
MAEGQAVLYEVRDGAAVLTIDRPDRRNALSEEVVAQLTDAVERAAGDPAVRVVVLTGTGDKAFCAGGDLSPSPGGLLERHWKRGSFVTLLTALRKLGKPSIARVNGAALGGGFGLMLSCHMVVAAEDATMGTPEVRLGLFPMMIMPIIFRNLGRKRATELILTGGRMDAREGERLGIVNHVVPRDRLDEKVGELVGQLASKSPAVLRLGLEAMDAASEMHLDEALPFLQTMLTLNTMTEDAAEGIMAFLGKREPSWKGK